MVLNAILFCFILLLCVLCFAGGYYFGLKIFNPEPKRVSLPLTTEQERQIEKRQKEMDNFWKYDGSSQE